MDLSDINQPARTELMNLLLQKTAVFMNRSFYIVDMVTQIQVVPGRLTHAAPTRGASRHHGFGRRPIGLQPGQR